MSAPSFITQVARPDSNKVQMVSNPNLKKKSGDLDDVVISVQNGKSVQKKGGFFGCFGCFRDDVATDTVQPDPHTQGGDDQDQYGQRNGNTPSISVSQRPSIVAPPFSGPALMPPLSQENLHKKTLVLDLDETLVHSSFKPVPDAHFVIPVEIENEIHKVYVLKRPGVDRFLIECAKLYEIVIFTASLAKYADPLLDQLDTQRVTSVRLFREACVHYCGNYVKDLSRLGRDMRDIIIVDNSPHSYAFHPYNAIAIDSWFEDMEDTQLDELHEFLVGLASVENVSTILDATKGRQF